MSAFWAKNVHFSRPKFLVTFLSHRPDFSDFPFLFQDFLYLYYVKCIYMTLPRKKDHYFRKEFLYDTFFYSLRTFARIRQHYFSKYWGDGCMGRPGRPPPQIFKFLGDRPPSPF